MKTTIEAVKDEVAKKNGYPILVNTKEWTRWDRMFEEATSSTKEQLLHEVVELYHTRKCEEDFKSIMLPVKSEIKEMQQSMGTSETFDWVLKRCSAMLASLQSQLEAKDKEMERIPYLISTIESNNQRIEELKSQLQEAKAEMKKFREVLRELVILKEMKDKDKGLKSEEYVTRKPIAWEKARELFYKSKNKTEDK